MLHFLSNNFAYFISNTYNKLCYIPDAEQGYFRMSESFVNVKNLQKFHYSGIFLKSESFANVTNIQVIYYSRIFHVSESFANVTNIQKIHQ